LDIGRDKKVAIEAVSQVMLDNHKWRLKCRKCERVKAKSFNYNAHAILPVTVANQIHSNLTLGLGFKIGPVYI
jgi:hypothetical protein